MNWEPSCRTVLDLVLQERRQQVVRYGFNDDSPDGTGPSACWLAHTDPNLDLRTASEIEKAFRWEYVRHEKLHGVPTWMHLVREEVAEAFKESDPERLTAELIQVAALCVSWVEAVNRRAR